MWKRVVVLGAQGMLGHIVVDRFRQISGCEVVGVARNAGPYTDKVLDVLNFAELEAYLRDFKPDGIINCIGILVAQSGSDLSTAVLINSYLPHFLAKLGASIGYKLVHISTDCVFSGKSGQYNEDSTRDGDDNYARTKALGEVINNRDLTIRTSIIGPELKTNGTGLLDWFLKQRGTVKGYSQAYWSGVTTLELAEAIRAAIEQNLTGLINLSPAQKISKYELLNKINVIWGRGNEVVPFGDYVVDKSLISKRRDFDYPKPDYDLMLNNLKSWMDARHGSYAHYNSEKK